MIKCILSAATLILIASLVQGIHVHSFFSAVIAVITLSILNFCLRPILVLLTLPVTILTLGLFMFIINAVTFYLAGQFFPGFKVDTWYAAFWGSLIYSFVSAILHI